MNLYFFKKINIYLNLRLLEAYGETSTYIDH